MTQQKRHEGNVETETQHSEGAAPPPAWKTEAVWAAGRGQGCGSSGPKVKIQGEASAENTGGSVKFPKTGMEGRRAGEAREGEGEEGSPGATQPSARTGGIQGVAAAADRLETGTLPAGIKAGAVGNRDSAKTDLGTVTQRKAAGDRDSARRAGKGLLSRAGGARSRVLAPRPPAGWGQLSCLDPLTPPYRLTFLSSAN
uniref:Uncharacterized protein n=1 Tax=Rangifer tarandus platyrhynchus TaxID=3082113 RepID=A0ACB0E1I9_RANTA|nr:unnamed protein product [Rangifer tarandus platyrhynchus]